MLILTDNEPRGLGYLEIDQRASSIKVAPQRGHDLPVGRPLFEADTYTCSHCQYVVILNPDRKRERYKCKGCSHHICDNCAAKMAAGAACKTYAQFIYEQQEAESRRSDSLIILP